MVDLMEPFASEIDMNSGIIDGAQQLIQRRLSDMRDMYADSNAVESLLSAGQDRLIYEVYATDLPEEEGQVLYCTTVIHPGQIGNEYHMTKGHFHSLRDRGEVYFGLAGEGFLILQTDEGESRAVEMKVGTAAYVPPYWAHRTVNTGTEPFVFFAAWPGDAGHDYGTIERLGFPQILVEQHGAPVLVDNPRYQQEM